jgi:hypothetical protein
MDTGAYDANLQRTSSQVAVIVLCAPSRSERGYPPAKRSEGPRRPTSSLPGHLSPCTTPNWLLVLAGKLRSHLAHVEVWLDEGPVWVRVCGAWEGLEVELVLPDAPIVTLLDERQPRWSAYALVTLEASEGPAWRLPWILAPFTCVEVVKAALGIRAPWVVTAGGLCAYLCRRGVVFTQRRRCAEHGCGEAQRLGVLGER